MSALNRKPATAMTTLATGTPVPAISAPKQLKRLVLASMLWEGGAYIDGKSHAEAVASAVKATDPKVVEALALEARSDFKLRHIPLLLLRELARAGKLSAQALTDVIQRPDEMGEFVSIYWKDGKAPLSNQVKKGLANCFHKFSEYQLAKNDKNSAAVSLRDVMFLTHPKPKTSAQAELFKRLADGRLATPDTWEVRLSAGEDSRKVFSELMRDNKLGALAFLRNLRNMLSAGIPLSELESYSNRVDFSKVLPFRFIAAARQVPAAKPMLERLMLHALGQQEKLPGRTVLVVDTSGSMGAGVSARSDLSRLDAAVALAILAREMCERVVIYATAGNDGTRKHATMEIPSNLRGFELSDYIRSADVTRQIGGGGIFLLQVMDWLHGRVSKCDRVVVFTDEQDCGGRGFEPHKARLLAPAGRNYIINVGSEKNGINSDRWETVTGFSEAVFHYILELER